MTVFTAHVTHTEETVNAFTKAQFCIFQRKKRFTMLAVAMLTLFAGALNLFGQTLSIILVMIGCMVLVDVANVPRRTARKLLEAKPALGRVEYEFGSRAVTVKTGGSSAEIPYKKLLSLAEDRSYFYMFNDVRGGYMMQKNSLEPNSPDEFRTMLSSKTGLSWTQTGSVLNLNLSSLVKLVKNKKR